MSEPSRLVGPPRTRRGIRPDAPHADRGVYRIVSMDAGGSHGLVTRTLLRRLEDARPGFLARATVFAGTIAGAVTALQLARADDPAAELDRAARYWRRPDVRATLPVSLARALSGVVPVYPSEPEAAALLEEFGPTMTLGDLKKGVVIPTIDLDNEAPPGDVRSWQARVHHNLFPMDSRLVREIGTELLKWDIALMRPGDQDQDDRLVDIALRAIARPIFRAGYQGHVAGDIYAVNPSMVATLMALYDSKPYGHSFETPGPYATRRILVLSLGAGRVYQYVADPSAPWGVFQWLLDPTHPLRLIDLTRDMVANMAAFNSLCLLGDQSYYRLNPPLPSLPWYDELEAPQNSLLDAALGADISGALRFLDQSGWFEDEPTVLAAADPEPEVDVPPGEDEDVVHAIRVMERLAAPPEKIQAVVASARAMTADSARPHDARDRYRILAMDAGGVHGLLTALLLRRVEDARPGFLARTTLLAGTSAGAIMALMLASARLDPSERLRDCLELWETPGLFDGTTLQTLGGLTGMAPLASIDGLKRALGAYLDPTQTLGALPRCVVVPTVELDNRDPDPGSRRWRPRVFHNFLTYTDYALEADPATASAYGLAMEGRPQRDNAQRALDVACRAASGPVGAPAYQGYLDGGLYASDPSINALALAVDHQKLVAERGMLVPGGLEDVLLFSVGTGHNHYFVAEPAPSWGAVQWLLDPVHRIRYLDLIVEAYADIANYGSLIALGTKRYLRVDPALPRSVSLLDIASTTSIPMLYDVAHSYDLTHTLAWLDASGWFDDQPPSEHPPPLSS